MQKFEITLIKLGESENPPLGIPFNPAEKNHRYVSSLRKTGRSIVHDRVIKNFAGTVEASVFPDKEDILLNEEEAPARAVARKILSSACPPWILESLP